MLQIICFVLGLYNLILFARVILSYFPNVPDGLRPIVRAIFMVTEPVVHLVRPLIPPLRIGNVALDLSIMLLFFLLFLVRQALGCGRVLGF